MTQPCGEINNINLNNLPDKDKNSSVNLKLLDAAKKELTNAKDAQEIRDVIQDKCRKDKVFYLKQYGDTLDHKKQIEIALEKMKKSNKTNKKDHGIISNIDFPYEKEITDANKTTDSKVFKIQTSMVEAKEKIKWSFLNILQNTAEAENVYKKATNKTTIDAVEDIVGEYLKLSDEIKNLKTKYLGEYEKLKQTENDAANQTRKKMYIKLGEAIGPYIKEKYEEDLIKQSDTIFKLYYMYYALFYGNDDLVNQLKLLKDDKDNITDFELLKTIGKEIDIYIKEEYNYLQGNENFTSTFKSTNRDKQLSMIKEVKEKNKSFEEIINGFNRSNISKHANFLTQFDDKKLGSALFYIIFNDTPNTKLSDIANEDLKQFVINEMPIDIARKGAFNHYFGDETKIGELKTLLNSNFPKEMLIRTNTDTDYFAGTGKSAQDRSLKNLQYNEDTPFKIPNYSNIQTTSVYIYKLHQIVSNNASIQPQYLNIQKNDKELKTAQYNKTVSNDKKIPIFIEHIKHLLTEMSKSDFKKESLTKLRETIVGNKKSMPAKYYQLYGPDFNSVIQKFDMFIQEMESATKSKSESISLPTNFKTYFGIGKYKQKSIKPQKKFVSATLSARIIELAEPKYRNELPKKPKKRGGNRITRRKKKRKNLVVSANISIKK